jgi:hypothetical protein
MSKTWLDFLPEHDAEMARRDPRYAGALRKTFAGQIAELKAAAAPLGESYLRSVEYVEARMIRLRDRSLARWFKDTQ